MLLVEYDIEASHLADGAQTLTFADISRLGTVLIGCNHDDDLTIAEWVRQHAGACDVIVLANRLSIETIIGLLDAGAAQVIVNNEQLQSLGERGVGQARLVGLVHYGQVDDVAQLLESVSDIYLESAGNALFRDEELTGISQSCKASCPQLGGSRKIYMHLDCKPNMDNIRELLRLDITPVIKSTRLTTQPVEGQDLLSIAQVLLCNVSSDRKDGLFPTIVTNIHNQALGLVYSSDESVAESIRTGTGVYQSRSRGLWYKGGTSGAVQTLIRIGFDCDMDCLLFVVQQKGKGFCHLETDTCFGPLLGLNRLERVLQSRLTDAPRDSYTARLFSDSGLLRAKLMEEAEELCDAEGKEDVAFEAADLLYFTLTKCVACGVTLADVEAALTAKAKKVSRRRGDAKPKWAHTMCKLRSEIGDSSKQDNERIILRSEIGDSTQDNERIVLRSYHASELSQTELCEILQRPVLKTSDIMPLVQPIIQSVKEDGDKALLKYTQKFDGVKLDAPVLLAPFPPELYNLPANTRLAIDIAFENIKKFHAAQLAYDATLTIETMPGVTCSRFSRPIECVGCYIPAGTAILPSTAMMLGVPALVAGCPKIVFASPPCKDGSISPEIVYIAHKVNAQLIVLAGGAQAISALAYGTESVPKCDKIYGPGNQFVTAAKMYVQNDMSALVGIDLPAGPSEVLVIADSSADPRFVASDILSQAEHGADSMSVLITVGLTDEQVLAIQDAVHEQASRLPRLDILKKSISHSVNIRVETIDMAHDLSNKFAPEHLILYHKNASSSLEKVTNAGSVFIGPFSPVACGDYASGTNHTLPTNGFGKMYSGVNTSSFQKHITAQELSLDGLRNIGPTVITLASAEGLRGHEESVRIRLGP